MLNYGKVITNYKFGLIIAAVENTNAPKLSKCFGAKLIYGNPYYRKGQIIFARIYPLSDENQIGFINNTF